MMEDVIIRISGDEDWYDGYMLGTDLDKRFPDQDADEFGVAVGYHGFPEIDGDGAITSFEMIQQGWNDGDNWIWRVGIDGCIWVAEGGCDYTGWDCVSNLFWVETLDES